MYATSRSYADFSLLHLLVESAPQPPEFRSLAQLIAEIKKRFV
jgi:hypothetical protein